MGGEAEVARVGRKPRPSGQTLQVMAVLPLLAYNKVNFGMKLAFAKTRFF
jgi:hypothetical protein